MINGLGTDILEISRFKRVLKKHSKRLLTKLFNPIEQEYCLVYKDYDKHLAARFAAKEAIAKALGCGFGKELSFLDITIVNEGSGKPTVEFSQKVNQAFDHPHFLISMSHSRDYATATAIWLS